MADLPKVPAPLLRLFFFPLLASSSSPRFASDLEQARPQTTGEEELQLQLALAMSREEAEKVGRRGGAAPYPGVWPLWRRGGLRLPEGCALTRNCTGLLALCLHPNHSRHGGSTMDGTQTRALLLEPGMAWDGVGGSFFIHQTWLTSTEGIWSCHSFVTFVRGHLCRGRSASAHGCSFGAGGAVQGCGQATSRGLNCNASSRPIPSPICSLAPFPWGQIICTPAEIVAGWHSVCGAHGDGRAHKGRSRQRPHTWAASLGRQHRVLRPAGLGDILLAQHLALPASPAWWLFWRLNSMFVSLFLSWKCSIYSFHILP